MIGKTTSEMQLAPPVFQSSDTLIFVKRRAKDGLFWTKLRTLNVVDLFAKQLNNALNVPKITNRQAKSQKYGRWTGDFPQTPV